MIFSKNILKWGLLLVAILLVGCSNKDNKDITIEEASYSIVELLADGNYKAVHQEWFSEELQESISLDDLKFMWENISKEGGDFNKLTSLKVESSGKNLKIAEGKVEFMDLTFGIRLIFDENKLLLGFNLSGALVDISMPDGIIEEDIIVGKGTSYELGGTLTLPKDKEDNLPAVVLVQGSGPSDRDESVFAYKPFRDIAWGLAEEGIASIRYDKRTYTYGEKMIRDPRKISVYEETVEDAIHATSLIKEDKRIDKNNVYIIGHSLGGMLGPRIDVQGGDYAGLVLLAGSPRALWEIIYDQNIALLEELTIDEDEKESLMETIEAEYEKGKLLKDISLEEAQDMTIFGLNGYYFKEMDEYNVESIISDLDKDLLIMQGQDDFQVYYEKDFAIWEDLLKDKENASLISYPNLNHFFIEYEGLGKGTLAEYELANQVDINVIKDIAGWIWDKNFFK